MGEKDKGYPGRIGERRRRRKKGPATDLDVV